MIVGQYENFEDVLFFLRFHCSLSGIPPTESCEIFDKYTSNENSF